MDVLEGTSSQIFIINFCVVHSSRRYACFWPPMICYAVKRLITITAFFNPWTTPTTADHWMLLIFLAGGGSSLIKRGDFTLWKSSSRFLISAKPHLLRSHSLAFLARWFEGRRCSSTVVVWLQLLGSEKRERRRRANGLGHAYPRLVRFLNLLSSSVLDSIYTLINNILILSDWWWWIPLLINFFFLMFQATLIPPLSHGLPASF